MSHTVTVKLIADQVIEVDGAEVNIHDIETVIVNDTGVIERVYLKKDEDTDVSQD